MPKAYWIVRVSVRDAQRYPEYLAAARPASRSLVQTSSYAAALMS